MLSKKMRNPAGASRWAIIRGYWIEISPVMYLVWLGRQCKRLFGISPKPDSVIRK